MNDTREPIGKVKLITLFVMVFLVGALAGTVATKWYVQKELKSMVRGDFGSRRARIVRRLSRRLNLTPSQRSRIETIIAQSQRELMSLRDQHFREVRRIFDETEAKIKAQLNPEQQVELDKMYEKLKARWEARSRARRPGGGPPPWAGRGRPHPRRPPREPLPPPQ